MSLAQRNEAQLQPPRAATRLASFLVIRHAESEANAGGYFASQSDSGLTELGRRQAAALAHALRNAPIHAVYSSDLTRARLTVAPIAASRGLELIATPVLRERAMGEFTGMTFETARERYPEVWARLVARDPHVAPPGGESHADLAARVRPLLAELTAKHTGQNVVIGSHGGTIHHIVRQLIGVHDLDLAFWLAVDNASVTRVDLTEPAPGVVTARLAYVNRVIPLEGTADAWV